MSISNHPGIRFQGRIQAIFELFLSLTPAKGCPGKPGAPLALDALVKVDMILLLTSNTSNSKVSSSAIFIAMALTSSPMLAKCEALSGVQVLHIQFHASSMDMGAPVKSVDIKPSTLASCGGILFT